MIGFFKLKKVVLMNIYIKNGKLVFENKVESKDILINDHYIKKVDKKENFTQSEVAGCEVIDANGCYIFPGIIDPHTHYLLKSRNSVTADDFYSGSVAAAFGGVTTFIDYIDDQQSKGMTFKESLQERKNEARDAVVDYSFHQVVTNYTDHIEKNLREVKDAGINNIKIFTTYRKEGYLIDDDKLFELFKILRQQKLLPTVHAEDNQTIEKNEEKYKKEGKTDLKYHPEIRTSQAEKLAIQKMAELSKMVELPLYIVHLSSKPGYNELKKQKEKGVDIYTETAPHYLVLNREFLNREDGYLYFMTPPLRTKEDNKVLWQGLKDDLIDVVATDHCSYNEKQKKMGDNAFNSLPGIPGSETLLPLIYHFGLENELEIIDIVSKLSVNPAKIFGLYPGKGSLKENTDADLVIFDPKKKRELNEIYLHSNSGYSPYGHLEVEGYPITTICRGNFVIKDGAYRGYRAYGRFLKAEQSSLFN